MKLSKITSVFGKWVIWHKDCATGGIADILVPLLTKVEKYLERFFPTLGKKIALAVIGVSLVAGSIFISFAQRTGATVLQQDARAKAHDLALLFRGVLEQAMLEGNPEQVAKVMISIASSRDVADVALVRRDGSVVCDGEGKPGRGPFALSELVVLGDSLAPRYRSVRENDTLYEWIVMPVESRQECQKCHAGGPAVQGYIAMKVEVSDVRNIALEHRATNILMTVMTFIGLGGVIYASLALLVIKPLGTLHGHIRGMDRQIKDLVSGQNMTFPLLQEIDRKDEIADLTRDFNLLLVRLNMANAKIFELHQAQLEHADRLSSTGEMAAGLAHEIKNPIAGVIGALQVFEADLPPDDSKREILTEMLVQLDRVNHTITDLLQYARPTPPFLEPVQVDEVLQKTIHLISQQVKRGNLNIQTSLDTEGVEILADRKQFQQLLWNLVLNGLQAMDGSGVLTVASSACDHIVSIRICDTGKGISPENLERIFKPFFTTKHKGTGLGMTITKRIVEQHGGTISVSSRVGEGTNIVVSFPEHIGVVVNSQA